MAYSYATGGSGWTMVPCMVTFLAEVKECVADGLLDVTNLGQLGDAIHKTEPTSRHNPARAPNGDWYVCAADFGGPDYALLAEFHRARYIAQDARLYRYGFSQRGDGYGLQWFDGAWKWTGRDQGHCHFDVNMAGPSLNSNWWVPALAFTTPWGLRAWLEQRRGLPITDPTDSTDTKDWFDMATQQDLVNAVRDTLRSEGVSGAGDWSTGQRADGSWPVGAQALTLMVRAVAEVLRTEGVSGAGDAEHLAGVIIDKLGIKGAAA